MSVLPEHAAPPPTEERRGIIEDTGLRLELATRAVGEKLSVVGKDILGSLGSAFAGMASAALKIPEASVRSLIAFGPLATKFSALPEVGSQEAVEQFQSQLMKRADAFFDESTAGQALDRWSDELKEIQGKLSVTA